MIRFKYHDKKDQNPKHLYVSDNVIYQCINLQENKEINIYNHEKKIIKTLKKEDIDFFYIEASPNDLEKIDFYETILNKTLEIKIEINELEKAPPTKEKLLYIMGEIKAINEEIEEIIKKERLKCF